MGNKRVTQRGLEVVEVRAGRQSAVCPRRRSRTAWRLWSRCAAMVQRSRWAAPGVIPSRWILMLSSEARFNGLLGAQVGAGGVGRSAARQRVDEASLPGQRRRRQAVARAGYWVALAPDRRGRLSGPAVASSSDRTLGHTPSKAAPRGSKPRRAAHSDVGGHERMNRGGISAILFTAVDDPPSAMGDAGWLADHPAHQRCVSDRRGRSGRARRGASSFCYIARVSVLPTAAALASLILSVLRRCCVGKLGGRIERPGLRCSPGRRALAVTRRRPRRGREARGGGERWAARRRAGRRVEDPPPRSRVPLRRSRRHQRLLRFRTERPDGARAS